MGKIEVTPDTFYKIFDGSPSEVINNERTRTYIYSVEGQTGHKVWNHASSKVHQYYLFDINL